MATRKRAPSKGSPKIRFVQISAIGTELYALDSEGRVFWYDDEPTVVDGKVVEHGWSRLNNDELRSLESR